MKGNWAHAAARYLKSEGLRQINQEAYESLVPEAVRNNSLPMVPDSRAYFGFRPPAPQTIRAHYNALAPYYEFQLMTVFGIEVKTFAFLAEFIDTMKPKSVIDAGCGTGLTTAFLAKQFPDVNFFAYDIAGKMIRRAKARCRKLGLANMQLFLAEHLKISGMPRDGFGLLIAKCAFGGENAVIPEFLNCPSPSMAQEEFYNGDPTMQRWEATLAGFARLLKPGGIFLDIGLACPDRDAAVWTLADRVGFEKDDSLETVIDTPADGGRTLAVTAVGYRKI